MSKITLYVPDGRWLIYRDPVFLDDYCTDHCKVFNSVNPNNEKPVQITTTLPYIYETETEK